MDDGITVTLPMSTRALKDETGVCTPRCRLEYLVSDAGVISLVHQMPHRAYGGNTVMLDPVLSRSEVCASIRFHHTRRF